MPLSSHALVELTPLADPLVRRGVGDKASEEARAAHRIALALQDVPRMPLGELMRRCNVPPTVMARLAQAGAVLLLETDRAVESCERCNRTPTPGTTLCTGCREYLGWARLAGRPVPRPPEVVEPTRRVARARGGGAGHMRTRRTRAGRP